MVCCFNFINQKKKHFYLRTYLFACFLPCVFIYLLINPIYVMCCAILHQLYNLKNLKNKYGGKDTTFLEKGKTRLKRGKNAQKHTKNREIFYDFSKGHSHACDYRTHERPICDALRDLVLFGIIIPPWVFFTLFKLYKWYQIAQRTTSALTALILTDTSTLHLKYSTQNPLHLLYSFF